MIKLINRLLVNNPKRETNESDIKLKLNINLKSQIQIKAIKLPAFAL